MSANVVTTQQLRTLRDVLVCARAWEPDARLVGNVTAGAIVDAIEALEIERYGCTCDEERYCPYHERMAQEGAQ